MQTSGNTILVTGGSSGIGLGLAHAFVEAGNEVIVCGRRKDALEALKTKLPAVHILVADTGSSADRQRLFTEATTRFPALNVLVNNAGIQRKVDFKKGEAWAETASEIAINLEGPMHLYITDRDSPLTKDVSNWEMDDEIYYDLEIVPEAKILAARRSGGGGFLQ